MSLARVAFLSLKRKKIRTILLVVSVMIAVSLLTGVNAGVDGLEKTYIDMVTTSLGYTDLIIAFNSSSPTFDIASVEPFSQDKLIAAYSFRVQRGTPFTSVNESFATPSWAYVVGANPELDEKFGEYKVLEGSINSIAEGLSQQRNACVITENYAKMMDVKAGDSIHVAGWGINESTPTKPGNAYQFEVVGVIRDYGRVYWFDSKDPDSFRRVYGSIFVNLATAQKLYDIPSNNVTHVYVHLSDVTEADSVKSRLQENLGSNYSICGLKAKMLGSIEQNVSSYRSLISLFGGMSLLVAVMLLLNSMFTAISERRYEIGILRSMGASRRQVFYVFLLEILLMGVVGALSSVPLAIVVARLITASFPAPYIQYVGKPAGEIEFVFSERTVITNVVTGIMATLIVGIVPSLAAARVEVVEALRPRMRVTKLRIRLRALTPVAGSILTLGGLYLVHSSFTKATYFVPGPEIFIGYAMTMIGIVLFTSLVLAHFSKALAYVLRPFISGLATVVYRNIVLNARRAVFTYGMIAVSTALIVTLGSLVSTVASYDLTGARYVFGADLVVWLSAPPAFAEEIRSIDGVKTAAGAAYLPDAPFWQSNMSYNGHYLKRGAVRIIGINSTDFFQAVYEVHLVNTLDGMAPNQVYSSFMAHPENMILQETLAQNLKAEVGDTVTWIYSNETRTLQADFRVIAIADRVAGAWETLYTFAKDEGFHMAIARFEDIVEYRSTAIGGQNFDQFYVSLKSDANVSRVIEELNQKCNVHGYHPWIGTATDRLNSIQSAYNQLQTLALVIMIFVTVVGALGVMATMAYAVFERRREIGILMALGVHRRQNIAIIAGETTILTLLGLIIGLTSGLALSYFVLQIIPWWYALPPPVLTLSWNLITLVLAITAVAALVSSAYPAYCVAKLTVTETLRR
ncbi:FtsX-like permease family protein [Candidatus Bathyarchaeota archaeon]|nr:FtsX-like permease family protein [Candidatus Bathyarchaeota archaeon]